MSDEMLVWLSVWSEVQTVCIWSSWCHHLLPYLNPDWFCLSGYRLTRVVLEKRPLNGCSGSSSFKPERWSTTHGVLNSEILKNFIFRVLSNVLAMHVGLSGTALRWPFNLHICFRPILFKPCFSCEIVFLFLDVDWRTNTKQTNN